MKLYPKKSKKPLQAIRYFCFECMGWDRRAKDSGKPFDDVLNCTDEMCPLFDFRKGRNPFHTRTVSSEELKRLRKGIKKARGNVSNGTDTMRFKK